MKDGTGRGVHASRNLPKVDRLSWHLVSSSVLARFDEIGLAATAAPWHLRPIADLRSSGSGSVSSHGPHNLHPGDTVYPLSWIVEVIRPCVLERLVFVRLQQCSLPAQSLRCPLNFGYIDGVQIEGCNANPSRRRLNATQVGCERCRLPRLQEDGSRPRELTHEAFAGHEAGDEAAARDALDDVLAIPGHQMPIVDDVPFAFVELQNGLVSTQTPPRVRSGPSAAGHDSRLCGGWRRSSTSTPGRCRSASARTGPRPRTWPCRGPGSCSRA